MKEYRVTWRQAPYNYNPGRVLFIEAASEDDARTLAKDHIERTYGITNFGVFDINPAQSVPAGTVRE